jgi:hypothetical protein
MNKEHIQRINVRIHAFDLGSFLEHLSVNRDALKAAVRAASGELSGPTLAGVEDSTGSDASSCTTRFPE